MAIKGAFTADVDPTQKDDIDKTLENIPFIKKHFFTGSSKVGIVIKIVCNTPKDLTDLETNLRALSGLSNFKSYPPEETGLSKVQKDILIKALAIAGITYAVSLGLIYGANSTVDPRYLFLVPILTAGSAFGYEFYYKWPR
jgi:hypothetical protein